MAGLAAAGSNAQAPAGTAALHGRRPENPLGARAMYLGSTHYRIHGSNEPWTIGHNVSSGCIRMRNADVIDLYSRVKVGTKVGGDVGDRFSNQRATPTFSRQQTRKRSSRKYAYSRSRKSVSGSSRVSSASTLPG